jgi:hypothetical protein
MKHAKKDPACAGEISEEGKSNSKGNGKIIPFGPKAGQFGKQKQRQGKGKEGIREKKSFTQIEITFPSADGNGSATADQLRFDDGRCKEGCPFGAWMGTCHAADCQDKKREEGIAAENR